MKAKQIEIELINRITDLDVKGAIYMTLQELYDMIDDKDLTIKIYESDDELYEPTPDNVAEYFDEIIIY